ncbi:MAG: membrane dipeptidase [Bacteroidales bacterium]|nr:membrane dipeptidase [Bacteroidales bacterium]
MRRIFKRSVFGAIIVAMVGCTSTKPDYNSQADKLCAKLITMDTHNHVDVPMITGDTPGPRVDLRTAMQKAGMAAIGMTFAVDYYYPLADGQALERYWNAVESQDSILAWSGLQRTLNLQQLKENFAKGEPVIIQCVEGGHFLEGDVSNLVKAYERGLRVFCLLHDNDANQPLGDVYTNQPKFGGLTKLGADAIRECERLGILVDLAHCDSTTIAMALEVATKPVLISHTGLSTRLGNNDFMGNMMRPRLITPDQAKMVAAKDGVIGIWPHLADSPEEYASNIKAMVDIVGIDHVCIGTDTKLTPDYMEMNPESQKRFEEERKQREKERTEKGEKDEEHKPNFPQKDPNAVNHVWNDQPDNFYHSVIRCLLAEGFNADEIEKIVCGNFFRVFDEATAKKR